MKLGTMAQMRDEDARRATKSRGSIERQALHAPRVETPRQWAHAAEALLAQLCRHDGGGSIIRAIAIDDDFAVPIQPNVRWIAQRDASRNPAGLRALFCAAHIEDRRG